MIQGYQLKIERHQFTKASQEKQESSPKLKIPLINYICTGSRPTYGAGLERKKGKEVEKRRRLKKRNTVCHVV